MKKVISVIVCTTGRSSLRLTLASILKNTFKDFEIIVISQAEAKKSYISSKILWVYTDTRGLSKARNIGIGQAQSEIVVFTDDDCVVAPDWLDSIYRTFQKHPSVDGIFGRVLPYKPEEHKNKTCPCCIALTDFKVIHTPCYHGESIGYGNNMAFRRNIFSLSGGFKEWLGINSIGGSAEDAEFGLRLIIKGCKIISDPKIIIYHNRWLSPFEYKKQLLLYELGEMSCYGYYMFQGYGFAKDIVYLNMQDSLYQLKLILKRFSSFKIKGNVLEGSVYFLKSAVVKAKGLFVGLYYSQLDPIVSKN